MGPSYMGPSLTAADCYRGDLPGVPPCSCAMRANPPRASGPRGWPCLRTGWFRTKPFHSIHRFRGHGPLLQVRPHRGRVAHRPGRRAASQRRSPSPDRMRFTFPDLWRERLPHWASPGTLIPPRASGLAVAEKTFFSRAGNNAQRPRVFGVQAMRTTPRKGSGDPAHRDLSRCRHVTTATCASASGKLELSWTKPITAFP
jgi:hypothetical protein